MVRRVLRIVTALAVAIIGLSVLIFIVGYGVDFFSSAAVRKEAEQALAEFDRLDRSDDGNAWEYYQKAIRLMETRTYDRRIDTYLVHSIAVSSSLQMELNRHNDISNLIRTGAAQPYCCIPIDYEKGLHAVLPNYRKLMECAKILNAQILVALEQGHRGRAVDKMIDGFTLSRHVMNGTPLMLNFMMGMRMVNLFAATLDIALSTGAFDENDLEKIVALLREYDQKIPPTVWVLQAENNGMKIMMRTIPPLYPMLDQIEMLKATLLDEMGMRLLFWRHGFSAKLAALSAVRNIDNIISDMQDDGKHKGSIEEDIQHANDFDDFLVAYRSKNEIMNIYATNWRGLFVSRTRSLAYIRLLYSAALLWLDRIEQGDFPQSLTGSEVSKVLDPYTGEIWEYIWTGDIVTLKSPGSDLVFDNQDDLSITLFRQSIQEFLDQIRP
ncbi:MAG: hypothetical protein JSW02_09400 [candidate division WOR-3 bacterium]|nr:MAG: hypothetical protein JSW02_09400 [candidate division WOR-3 bacterium]